MGGKQDNGDYALARSRGVTITPGVYRMNGRCRLSEARSEECRLRRDNSKSVTMDAVTGLDFSDSIRDNA
jgi:hypothetical protein